MASDVREKAKKLVALAAKSPNETEARNAALAACKLIDKHALLDERRYASAEAYAPTGNPFEDFLRDVMGATVRTRPRPAPTPPQPTVERPHKRPPRDPTARTIPIVDQTAFCAACGQRIMRGKFAMWSRGVVYHPTCYENATEA